MFEKNILTIFVLAIKHISCMEARAVFGKFSAVRLMIFVWSARGWGRVMAILQKTWMVELAVFWDVKPSQSCGIEGSKSWKKKWRKIVFVKLYGYTVRKDIQLKLFREMHSLLNSLIIVYDLVIIYVCHFHHHHFSDDYSNNCILAVIEVLVLLSWILHPWISRTEYVISKPHSSV